jgi:hypothetical protein
LAGMTLQTSIFQPEDLHRLSEEAGRGNRDVCFREK